MLSRPPTKITLTQADITLAEERKAARDRASQFAEQDLSAIEASGLDSSQDSTQDLSENVDSPAVTAQAQAARARKAREARIMGAGSRG
jgi:galactokinase/mevalonate kinase-like predicted kinase